MPYKRVGRTVYVKKEGRWHVKSTCNSTEDAKKQLRLLQAAKHN